MHLFIEKGLRRGMSVVTKRHAVANNKYMRDYDPNKKSVYIPYYDANNLYGWAMSEPLPTHGHEWMTDEELNNWQDILCILEVDLEYPDKLHDIHNDLPLAPEHVMVEEVKKRIPNLNDKTKYVIHYKALKQCISMGLKVTKIHRGVKFEESPWLAKYIEKNTDSRKKATSKSRKIYLS